jgi:hypothetical protein
MDLITTIKRVGPVIDIYIGQKSIIKSGNTIGAFQPCK